MNNITFGTKLINYQEIKKYNSKTKKYEPYNSAFVEIEPRNVNDMLAVNGTQYRWYDEEYASDIAYTAELLNSGVFDSKKHKIYALVSPEFNAKELRTCDILALAEMELKEQSYPRLERLQVDPELIYNPFFVAQRPFKRVGSGVLDSLKNIYNAIILSASCSATTFYEKNDFKRINLPRLIYLWKSKG